MGRGAARVRSAGGGRGPCARRAGSKGRSLRGAGRGPFTPRKRAARRTLPGAGRRLTGLIARQNHNFTLAILTFAGIAFALQQTMVIPALPALQRDLHTTTTWVTWVLTVFLLVASVATPILGKLG